MEKKFYTVAEINEEIKLLLEGDFILNNIQVKGEVTSLNKHYTGHYYFKLKDENGSILSCVMFKSYAYTAYKDLKDGDEILAFGSINVYEKGGTYSLNVKHVEKYGLGQYLLKLKTLEDKLQKEGYFDIKKKNLPIFPKLIGVLTASTGAAIHDVCSTILKRCGTNINVYPCLVQGDGASKSIIKAFKKACLDNVDVIILTRGGGSKEDLYAFNDEDLVKLVATSNIPVISAIGHSIDTSLVDKVATKACITPTDAGEAVILNKNEYLRRLDDINLRLNNSLTNKLDNINYNFFNLSRSLDLFSPNNLYKSHNDKLININKNLDLYINKIINEKMVTLSLIKHKLKFNNSRFVINKNLLLDYGSRLNKAISNAYNHLYQNLNLKITTLNNLNPYNLLFKGYSLLNKNGKVISSVKQINVNDKINISMSDGLIEAKILKIETKEEQ